MQTCMCIGMATVASGCQLCDVITCNRYLSHVFVAASIYPAAGSPLKRRFSSLADDTAAGAAADCSKPTSISSPAKQRPPLQQAVGNTNCTVLGRSAEAAQTGTAAAAPAVSEWAQRMALLTAGRQLDDLYS